MQAVRPPHRGYTLAQRCWHCGLPGEAWRILPLRLPGVPPERYCSLQCALAGERDYPTLAR